MLAGVAAGALLLAACGSSPTPTSQPTPTPPFGLPPLALPADESPHDFQTEWWYFNLHLTGDGGERYAIHDVIFQVQQLESGRTLYVRQVGFSDADAGTHVSAERLRAAASPLSPPAGTFDIVIGPGSISGQQGATYRLAGDAGGSSYDLTLRSIAAPLSHDKDGLVDFDEAGVTYYYSRPRLEASGTVTSADGEAHLVSGLGWLDKQWGDFQPAAVTWDWASVQLDDGTDLMLTRLLDRERNLIDAYATLRLPGQSVRRLGAGEFELTPLSATWRSERTGTTYQTRWRVRVPAEGIEFVLEPLVVQSEFVSSVLGVTYWEAGADAIDPGGQRIGQGFVELNWARGTTP